MLFDPSKHLGRKGYVKMSDGLYAYGSICETGISGAAGYYALLEFFTDKNRQAKLLLEDIRELIVERPRKGKIVGEKDGKTNERSS